MITTYYRTIKEPKLLELSKFKVGTFIYVEKTNEEELETIAKNFKLDPATIRDVLDPYEVPRLETEDNIFYIFMRLPVRKNNLVTTSPVLVIYSDSFVMLITKDNFNFIDKMILTNDFYTTQKTKLLIKIFAEMNKLYNNFLIDISRQVRNASGKLEKIDNSDIIKLVSYESMINDFLAALVPSNAILSKLLSGKFITLYETDKDIVEDLYLADNQLVELCRATLKNIVNVRDAYSTIMTHNLNRVLKILASLTIVMTIPTVVGSFYGMNVPIPGEGSPYAFGYIVSGTMLVSVVTLIVFAKNKWL